MMFKKRTEEHRGKGK